MTRQTNFDEEEKVWSAVHTPIIFNPNISMGHSILWSLARSPNKLIQVKLIILIAVIWFSLQSFPLLSFTFRLVMIRTFNWQMNLLEWKWFEQQQIFKKWDANRAILFVLLQEIAILLHQSVQIKRFWLKTEKKNH